MSRLSVATLALFLAWGCTAAENTSSPKHDADRPVNEASPHQWLDSSREDFVNLSLFAFESMVPEQLLPEDHRATQVAQRWLDEIDDRLRARFPEKLRHTPRPRAVVVVSKETNAFVSPMLECLGMPVRIRDESGAQPMNGDEREGVDVVLERFTGRITKETNGVKCLKLDRTSEERQALLDWVLEAYPGCRAEVQSNEIVLRGCDQYVDASVRNWGGDELHVMKTSPYVTFMTGLITMSTEEEFVSTVAHELGHYYMSHVTAPSDLYDYFYFIEDRGAPHKPHRDQEAEELGARLREILERSFVELQKVEGQAFRTEIFMVMHWNAWRLANAQCNFDPECTSTCKTLRDMTLEDFGSFPWMPLPPDKVDLFKRFEDQMRHCAEEVRVERDVPFLVDEPTHAISWSNLAEAFDNISPEHAQLATQFAERTGNLLEILERLNAELVARFGPREEERRNAYLEAASKRLGWYTAEQEADDLSAEWMTLLGLDAHTIVDLELKLLEVNDFMRGPTDLDAATCRALYERGWEDEKGHPVFVSPADFEDPHHGGCFRAFNVSREIEAHGYDHRGHPAAKTDPKEWRLLVSELENLEDEFSNLRLEPTGPFLKRGICRAFAR